MKCIVVDVETSGISINSGGRVIEFGAVAMERGRIVAELATLIDTGAQISYSAFLVHGISMGMLTGSPAPETAWPCFLEFVGDAPLVAHNAPFDRAFVCNELARLGMSLKNHWYCTVRLARKNCRTCQITVWTRFTVTCSGNCPAISNVTGPWTMRGSRRACGRN